MELEELASLGRRSINETSIAVPFYRPSLAHQNTAIFVTSFSASTVLSSSSTRVFPQARLGNLKMLHIVTAAAAAATTGAVTVGPAKLKLVTTASTDVFASQSEYPSSSTSFAPDPHLFPHLYLLMTHPLFLDNNSFLSFSHSFSLGAPPSLPPDSRKGTRNKLEGDHDCGDMKQEKRLPLSPSRLMMVVGAGGVR